MPYAGYPRVSRQGAREDERFRSPQFQRELIERYALAEGVELEMAEPEIDVSGSKPRRAILDGLVERVERGELAGIIVAKLDRLSRLAPKDRVSLFDRIESAGGVILSASEQLDASTPEGRFAREVFLGVARMEWEKYAENFETAKENAIAEGIPIKARVPFGYRRGAGRRLEVVERDAAIVRELFERRAGGASYGDVLAHFEQATGRSSYRKTMSDLLANRTYLGELHYGRVAGDELANLDAHAAIVPLELFDDVQRINAARAHEYGRKRTAGKPKALLAGIARCQGCGRGLVESATGSARSRSYKCPNDTRHCSSRAHILARELNAFVIERVLDWAGPAADELVECELELDAAGERIVAEQRLADAERSLLEWSTNLELEDENADAYRAGRVAREQRIERRRQELDACGLATELETARATIREALAADDADVDEGRRLLAVVLDCVIVRRTPRVGAPARERAALHFRAATEPIAEDALELV